MARRKRREPETAVIESATHDGRGIVAGDGKKVFVAGALPGETVTFMRRKSRRNYDEAELLEVVATSADRQDAKCEAFGRCGGCSLQHVSDDYQRDLKQQSLLDNLQRIGNVTPGRLLTPMCGPAWNYRRRARLAVKDVPAKGRVLVGFREKHAPYIADMHRCEVLSKPVDGLLDALSELISQLSIRARLPQIEVAVGENATALVFRVLDPPTDEDKHRISEFARRHDLRVYLQPGGINSIELLSPEHIDQPLHYNLPAFNVRVEFDPLDFVQVNSAINERMVAFAVQQMELSGDDRVLDLFCGIGNFSLPLGRGSRAVLGIEGEKTLVDKARTNAAINALDNVEFRCADLNKIDGSEAWMSAGWDRVLLDPARSGAAEVVARIELLGPEKIVYVSCHPGTLARDAAVLVHDKGYALAAAGIIDMFPHTAHVESIAVFTKSC